MKTKLHLLLFCIFALSTTSAQEFYGGEIRVRQLATYSVSATVNLFTAIHEDLDSIQLCWGNGPCEYLPLIYSESFPESSIKYHQFEANHTYGQQGTYTLTVDGCCWTADVLNMEQPLPEDFHLQTDFFLSVNDPLFGENFMPSFSRGFEVGESGLPIQYVSNFFDPEGDEVKFEVCELDYITTYNQPTDVYAGPPNQLSLDSLNGSFLWAAPQLYGNYVLAVCVTEYRNGVLISEQTRNIVIRVKMPVSNEEVQSTHQIEVFPNPVSSVLNIKMAEESSYNRFFIFDSLGRIIKAGTATNEIDLSGLSNGIYVLQMQFGDQAYNQRVVVNH